MPLSAGEKQALRVADTAWISGRADLAMQELEQVCYTDRRVGIDPLIRFTYLAKRIFPRYARLKQHISIRHWMEQERRRAERAATTALRPENV